ncbi:MAG: beta-propeller domain-containing protein [Candidatus Izemoplasmatales bacterium]
MSVLFEKPYLFIAGFLAFTFLILMMIKVIREFYFNKLLKEKQGQMRMSSQSRSFTKRMGLLTTTALVPIVVFVLVVALSVNPPSIPSGNLQEIRSSNDILEIYNEFNELAGSFTSNRDDIIIEDSAAESPENEQGSDDYSETNMQVQGVDEMDNVITDGKYIYQMRNNQVLITLAYTLSQESNVLSNYKVIEYIDEETSCPTGMYVTGLYVDDDYLVVVGSEYQYYYCNPIENGEDSTLDVHYYDYWYGYNNNIKIFVYDKNNDFTLTGEYDLSGNLIGTRKIDDKIYVVTNSWLPLNNEDIVIDDYLPSYSINEQTSMAKYEDIAYVKGIAPNSFTSFFAIDLENESVDMEVVLGDSGYNLYVSNNNIYLVGNIYYYLTTEDQEESTETIEYYQPKTAIQKISINDGNLEYASTGVVPGYTLNQFSMDESNGYLRIATTTGWWGEDINNRLFILDENLEEISRLENLGKPRETIRSVRFVGDYGYIVTFEQTDPFYVINLSDPENPFKEGELEIPGFSTYLQALNNQFMLGIGFGDSSGGTNGLKISIYDISDKTNPQVFDEVIFDYADFGWGWSSATYNHKDLLVSLSKGIIALPFSTYDWSQESGYIYNSGILVYHFDEVNGLSKSGFITHDQNSEEDVYVYKIKFIDQYFYTISDTYIKASLISNPEDILNSVTLPQYQYNYGDYDQTELE